VIPVKNIYYMLAYAFQTLNEQGYKSLATEEFENIAELCSEILVRGMKSQIKRGIMREYIPYSEETSLIRGKINVTESVKKQTNKRNKLVCEYDEYSLDCTANRIIKCTLLYLLKLNTSKAIKREIRNVLVYLKDVTEINRNFIDWNINFNRNNQTYRMMIAICYLVLKGLIQTNNNGTTKMMDFLDIQKMYRLYEKFLLEYFKKEHKELSVSSSQIGWQLDDDYSDMLPIMQSDILIEGKEKVLIIDAKYYENILQGRYDKKSVHSGNLYQIFTYVKNKKLDTEKEVIGMLLYAKTDEEIIPDNIYSMSGNKIIVRTLDLNQEFELIRKDLDLITKILKE